MTGYVFANHRLPVIGPDCVYGPDGWSLCRRRELSGLRSHPTPAGKIPPRRRVKVCEVCFGRFNKLVEGKA